ncbi:iron-containing alcohol dehydrogenase [Lachnospiraceae bacterium 47-T17]
MKDFQLRNDTKLLFRNDPAKDLQELTAGKKALFVYGGGSVKRNGCYDDVKNAITKSGGTLYEAGGSSRERKDIETGIRIAKENQVDLIVGAGGASVMDCAKLIAFGVCHTEDLWDFVKGKAPCGHTLMPGKTGNNREKNPYGLEKLPLILMPTYPSSGSEYGLGAVSVDTQADDFGTAYGIAADYAVLVPKYSLSLGQEMTAYTGLVTLVQLSASTIGDKNPVSYDIGISVIRNVLKATRRLKEHPDDLDARGVILYGASIATSGRLGIGKEENYSYDIYEVEFIPEALFGASYRKSLTTLFPRFLKAMAAYHEEEIRAYFRDAFGYEGDVDGSAAKLVALFEELGIDMYFEGDADETRICQIPIDSVLDQDEVIRIIRESMQ